MHPASAYDGKTQLYGLVGSPLLGAKSPELLNRLFVECSADAVCIPFVVGVDDLPAFVTGARALQNLRGILVTMPHKERMLAFVDELHPTAAQLGAVNVIRCEADGRWVGASFDGMGCVLGMERDGHRPAGKKVLLIGAGGAGRAIAFAVAFAGARSLTIANLDKRRSVKLAEDVAAVTDCQAVAGPADPRGFDIVINATPLGMNADDALPVDPQRLDPSSVVVDIVTGPAMTPLLRAAAAHGCRTQDGRPMHQGQAVHALRFLGFDYIPEGSAADGTGDS